MWSGLRASAVWHWDRICSEQVLFCLFFCKKKKRKRYYCENTALCSLVSLLPSRASPQRSIQPGLTTIPTLPSHPQRSPVVGFVPESSPCCPLYILIFADLSQYRSVGQVQTNLRMSCFAMILVVNNLLSTHIQKKSLGTKYDVLWGSFCILCWSWTSRQI